MSNFLRLEKFKRPAAVVALTAAAISLSSCMLDEPKNTSDKIYDKAYEVCYEGAIRSLEEQGLLDQRHKIEVENNCAEIAFKADQEAHGIEP